MRKKGEKRSAASTAETGGRVLGVADILFPKVGLTSDRLNAYFRVSVSLCGNIILDDDRS